MKQIQERLDNRTDIRLHVAIVLHPPLPQDAVAILCVLGEDLSITFAKRVLALRKQDASFLKAMCPRTYLSPAGRRILSRTIHSSIGV